MRSIVKERIDRGNGLTEIVLTDEGKAMLTIREKAWENFRRRRLARRASESRLAAILGFVVGVGVCLVVFAAATSLGRI